MATVCAGFEVGVLFAPSRSQHADRDGGGGTVEGDRFRHQTNQATMADRFAERCQTLKRFDVGLLWHGRFLDFNGI